MGNRAALNPEQNQNPHFRDTNSRAKERQKLTEKPIIKASHQDETKSNFEGRIKIGIDITPQRKKSLNADETEMDAEDFEDDNLELLDLNNYSWFEKLMIQINDIIDSENLKENEKKILEVIEILENINEFYEMKDFESTFDSQLKILKANNSKKDKKDGKEVKKSLKKIKKILQPIDLILVKEIVSKTTQTKLPENLVEMLMVLGFTGSGKSTIIHYLMGSEFYEEDLVYLPRENSISDEYLENVKVGKSGVKSETSEFIPIPLMKYDRQSSYICDTPGFSDSRGKNLDLAFRNMMIRMIKYKNIIVKPIIILEMSYFDSKAKKFKELALICHNIFGAANFTCFRYILNKLEGPFEGKRVQEFKKIINELASSSKTTDIYDYSRELASDISQKLEDKSLLEVVQKGEFSRGVETFQNIVKNKMGISSSEIKFELEEYEEVLKQQAKIYRWFILKIVSKKENITQIRSLIENYQAFLDILISDEFNNEFNELLTDVKKKLNDEFMSLIKNLEDLRMNNLNSSLKKKHLEKLNRISLIYEELGKSKQKLLSELSRKTITNQMKSNVQYFEKVLKNMTWKTENEKYILKSFETLAEVFPSLKKKFGNIMSLLSATLEDNLRRLLKVLLDNRLEEMSRLLSSLEYADRHLGDTFQGLSITKRTKEQINAYFGIFEKELSKDFMEINKDELEKWTKREKNMQVLLEDTKISYFFDVPAIINMKSNLNNLFDSLHKNICQRVEAVKDDEARVEVCIRKLEFLRSLRTFNENHEGDLQKVRLLYIQVKNIDNSLNDCQAYFEFTNISQTSPARLSSWKNALNLFKESKILTFGEQEYFSKLKEILRKQSYELHNAINDKVNSLSLLESESILQLLNVCKNLSEFIVALEPFELKGETIPLFQSDIQKIIYELKENISKFSKILQGAPNIKTVLRTYKKKSFITEQVNLHNKDNIFNIMNYKKAIESLGYIKTYREEKLQLSAKNLSQVLTDYIKKFYEAVGTEIFKYWEKTLMKIGLNMNGLKKKTKIAKYMKEIHKMLFVLASNESEDPNLYTSIYKSQLNQWKAVNLSDPIAKFNQSLTIKLEECVEILKDEGFLINNGVYLLEFLEGLKIFKKFYPDLQERLDNIILLCKEKIVKLQDFSVYFELSNFSEINRLFEEYSKNPIMLQKSKASMDRYFNGLKDTLSEMQIIKEKGTREKLTFCTEIFKMLEKFKREITLQIYKQYLIIYEDILKLSEEQTLKCAKLLIEDEAEMLWERKQYSELTLLIELLKKKINLVKNNKNLFESVENMTTNFEKSVMERFSSLVRDKLESSFLPGKKKFMSDVSFSESRSAERRINMEIFYDLNKICSECAFLPQSKIIFEKRVKDYISERLNDFESNDYKIDFDELKKIAEVLHERDIYLRKTQEAEIKFRESNQGKLKNFVSSLNLNTDSFEKIINEKRKFLSSNDAISEEELNNEIYTNLWKPYNLILVKASRENNFKKFLELLFEPKWAFFDNMSLVEKKIRTDKDEFFSEFNKQFLIKDATINGLTDPKDIQTQLKDKILHFKVLERDSNEEERSYIADLKPLKDYSNKLLKNLSAFLKKTYDQFNLSLKSNNLADIQASFILIRKWNSVLTEIKQHDFTEFPFEDLEDFDSCRKNLIKMLSQILANVEGIQYELIHLREISDYPKILRYYEALNEKLKASKRVVDNVKGSLDSDILSSIQVELDFEKFEIKDIFSPTFEKWSNFLKELLDKNLISPTDENFIEIMTFYQHGTHLEKILRESSNESIKFKIEVILKEFTDSLLRELAQALKNSEDDIKTYKTLISVVQKYQVRIPIIKDQVFQVIENSLTRNNSKGSDFMKNLAIELMKETYGSMCVDLHKSLKKYKDYLFNGKIHRLDLKYIVERNEKSNRNSDIMDKIKLYSHEEMYKKEFNSILKNAFLESKKTKGSEFSKSFLAGLKSEILDLIDENEQNSQKFFWTEKIKSIIPTLLAKVAALWSLMNSSIDKAENDIKPDEIKRPHSGQLFAIFRMLGLGFNRKLNEGLENNIVEVFTGEGKSLAIALVSTIFALYKIKVRCVCYSRYLNERDYESFKGFYDYLEIKDLISYQVYQGLCESVINERGEIRKFFNSCILNEPIPEQLIVKDRKILIIDEVDVFFTKEFLSGSYNISSTVSDPNIIQMLEFIWSRRLMKTALRDVQRESFYQNLCRLYMGKENLIKEAIKIMIKDSKQILTDYVVEDDTIYIYQSGGKISNFELGYKKVFTYFKEYEDGNISLKAKNEAAYLHFNCGSFAYSKIIKENFCKIIGITGTLKDLSSQQREIMEMDFNLSINTYVPSVFGDSNRKFSEYDDVHVEDDADQFFIFLTGEITRMVNSKRAVLVFFTDEQKLNRYTNHSTCINGNFKEKLLTDKTPHKETIILESTNSGSVTFLTREMGRGVDFVCYDKTVLDNQGVHVIQTFFSLQVTEEVQIRGRCARQGEKGSYSLILLKEEILPYIFSNEEACDENKYLGIIKKKEVYQIINRTREILYNKEFVDLETKIKEVENEHKYSIELLNQLLDKEKDKKETVMKELVKRNKADYEDVSNRILVLIDATESMEPLITKLKDNLFKMFEKSRNYLQQETLQSPDCFEVQIVAYRDYDATLEEILQISEWSNDPLILKDFLNKVDCFGGDDIEEAIEMALCHANYVHKNEGVKQIILILYAPAKNLEAIKRDINNYVAKADWEKYPYYIQYTDYKRELSKLKNVPINAIYLKETARINFEEIAKLSGGKCIPLLDLSKGDTLSDMMIQVILEANQAGLSKKYASKFNVISYL